MPHFYFHLRTPAGLKSDKDGMDFVDLETAYLEAYLAIPDMSADLVRQKRNPLPYAFEIADEAGRLLMEVPFAEFLRDPKPRRPAMAALVPKAQAERERTARLIASIREVQTTLMATLHETQELVARARGANV